MLLVIFGAGASYDSAAFTDEALDLRGLHRPPLAQGLVSEDFDGLAARIPESRPIVALLRRKLGAKDPQALELALAEIAVQGRTSIARRRQLIAFRFHLWQLIHDVVEGEWVGATHGQTHYLHVLNYLLDWQETTQEQILLATFNYDALLDMAAREVVTGWALNSLDSYIERPDFRLFKLHGSTRWSRQLEYPAQAGDARQFLINRAMDLDQEIGDIVPSPPEPRFGPNGEVRFPSMAIPMAGKTNFECPRHHLDILKLSMPEVTRLLLIGWRAAEPHAVEFLGWLRDGYRLGIVTKGDDGWEDVKANLGSVYDKAEVRVVEKGGFSAHISNLDVQLGDLLGPMP